MIDSHDLYPSRSAVMADLLQRLSSSSRTATLELNETSDTDEVEAFLIAIFETTRTSQSYREQDELIRSVVARMGETETVCLKGCGVAVILTPDQCEVRHHQMAVPVDAIAAAMIQALTALNDPTGMVIASLARVWDSPSIKMTRRATTTPPLA